MAVGLYQVPAVRSRVEWRLDAAGAFIRVALDPVGEVPTPLPMPVVHITHEATAVPTQTLSTCNHSAGGTNGGSPREITYPNAFAYRTAADGQTDCAGF